MRGPMNRPIPQPWRDDPNRGGTADGRLFLQNQPQLGLLCRPSGLEIRFNASPMAHAMGFRSFGPPGLRLNPASVAAGVPPAVEGGVSPPGLPDSKTNRA